MKQLTVSLDYSLSDLGRDGVSNSGLVLPIKVLDADGSVLAVGAASVDLPVTFSLPDEIGLVFVRLSWPSGRTETQSVDLQMQTLASVTFNDSHISPNEWSAWAIPKLNRNTPLTKANGQLDLGLERFERVWLRLWKFDHDSWRQERIEPLATYCDDAAWQLDLSLGPHPWLLQVGGSKVTWRFVSLPGGGSARVLITPKDSSDPRADELKVIVTSFGATAAETLLEFLGRDSMRAADALAHSASLVNKLIAEQFVDPLSAVAGAYYLIRVDAWNRLPRSWFENLSREFDWLPDASIVHCIRLLREGKEAQSSEFKPLDLFVESLTRGWPVYSEGITLLQEAAASLRGTFINDTNRAFFDRARNLGAAKAWAGAAASFYGRSPDEPSTLLWAGMPRAPRRRSLNPALRMPASTPSARAVNSLVKDIPKIHSRAKAAAPSRVISIRDDTDFLLGDLTEAQGDSPHGVSMPDRVHSTGRVLVTVHGIGSYHPGYSEGWWQALAPHVGTTFNPSKLGLGRREVLWSDLVNRRQGSLPMEDAIALKQALLDAIGDRLSHEASRLGRLDQLPSAKGSATPIDDILVYMLDDGMRRRILERFTRVVGPLLAAGTRIDVISHSWGTVVAYEGLRELEKRALSGRVANWFTVGSALSIAPVQGRLRPENRPANGRRAPYPALVDAWINLDAKGDPVGGPLGDHFPVTREYLDLEPTTCARQFWGGYDIGCAQGSYFKVPNLKVNRDIFAGHILGSVGNIATPTSSTSASSSL